MRRMEEDRLCQLRNLAEQYHQIMTDNRPKLVASSQRLAEPIELCDISRDMEAVKKKVGNKKNDLIYIAKTIYNIIRYFNLVV